MEIGVKRLIALAFVAAYIIFTGYEVLKTGNLSQVFENTVGMVIAYYFGRGAKDETTNV